MGRQSPLSDVISDAFADARSWQSLDADRTDQRTLLTQRELEVLALLAEGLTNREIAERLFIGKRTAQTHVQHILDKLDVNTRMAAATRATELGLV